jgi:UDP-N-acetyl-D-mannosaminuronic acid dehydrogenase
MEVQNETGVHTVAVIGLGYVGFPAAVLLAKAGYRVSGVDVREELVAAINNHTHTIPGEGIDALCSDPEVCRNLSATTCPGPADVFIIAVPTPVKKTTRISDLSYVEQAVGAIAPHLATGNLVIIESTIPPLTCRGLVAPMIERATQLKVPDDVMLAHCPERILPGNILHEIIHNDRIIGGMDECSTQAAKQVYASFVRGQLLTTDDVTAELCKLMENTYRDVNIALANEMSEVAERLGVKWETAFAFANRHPRVNYLRAGIGVGGHCIPIDPWFIKEVDPDNTRLLEAARRINDERPSRIAAKIRRMVSGVRDPRIVAIGATYKPDTDDLRESPAMEVVRLLRLDGYDISHYDPLVADMGYASIAEIAAGADALVVLVNHTQVAAELIEHSDDVRAAMRTPLIVVY